MVRIAIMTIRIMAPDDTAQDDAANQRIVENFNWERLQDIGNDQLPEGYYCKIEDH